MSWIRAGVPKSRHLMPRSQTQLSATRLEPQSRPRSVSAACNVPGRRATRPIVVPCWGTALTGPLTVSLSQRRLQVACGPKVPRSVGCFRRTTSRLCSAVGPQLRHAPLRIDHSLEVNLYRWGNGLARVDSPAFTIVVVAMAVVLLGLIVWCDRCGQGPLLRGVMDVRRGAVHRRIARRDYAGTKSQTLTNSAQTIADMVGWIGSIAGQTNPLASSATVEAARAVDGGKGFAVMAADEGAWRTRSAGPHELSATRSGGGPMTPMRANDSHPSLVSSWHEIACNRRTFRASNQSTGGRNTDAAGNGRGKSS
jgi:Methyl-accepting chemotaxis protein (MCP) signalling domain